MKLLKRLHCWRGHHEYRDSPEPQATIDQTCAHCRKRVTIDLTGLRPRPTFVITQEQFPVWEKWVAAHPNWAAELGMDRLTLSIALKGGL